MVILALLLIPTMVALGFLVFGGRKFTLKEFLVQMGAQTVVMVICAGVLMWSNTSDTELLNGRITNKHRDVVACEHSYQCNCYESCTSSGKTESCTTICQTCYEHSFDVDWTVDTSIGQSFTIDRVDRQGLGEPPRWDAVRIGEPFSTTHGYTNYIKAAPNSLFRYQGLEEKYVKLLPGYPDNVYDYYHVNRLVTVGVALSDANAWNRDLEELNADLGAKKQVNMLVVVVKDQPEEYFYALQQHWMGGKKNDAALVISVDQALNIQWVNVMAWTDNKMYQVALADSIRDLKVLDRAKVLSAFRTQTDTYYVRKHMKDFAYLKSSVTPTMGQWVFCMILGLIISIGLGIYFELNDPFDDDWRNNRYGNWR